MYISSKQLAYPKLNLPVNSHRVRSLVEKGSGEFNEDVLLVAGDLFGVFDGATSLDKRRFQDGQTGGLLAAKIAALTFQNSRLSLDRLAEKANQDILQAQLNERIAQDERHKLWSTSLAVIRLETNRFEYCQTGDALIVLVLSDGSHRMVTPDIDIDRDTLQLWKEKRESPEPRMHEILANQIEKVRLEMNISYGVLNGEPKALDFIQHGYEDLTNVSDILLFTDGLHLPREYPFDDHDWHSFVALYRRGGLRAVRNHVRDLQKQDPECSKYPRFKLHDDIAAVAISR